MSLESDHDATDGASTSTSRSIDNTFVSPAFEKHLHYPSQIERKRPLSDRQKQKMKLPHAVSGDEYRKFLREAQEKKENEAKQKEEREQRRIEKRKEREQEAERKKREQERKKKHERELKKLEVERKKLEAERRRLEATRKKNEMEQKKLRRERKKQKKRQVANVVKESSALDEENEPVMEEPDEVYVRERRKRKHLVIFCTSNLTWFILMHVCVVLWKLIKCAKLCNGGSVVLWIIDVRYFAET